MDTKQRLVPIKLLTEIYHDFGFTKIKQKEKKNNITRAKAGKRFFISLDFLLYQAILKQLELYAHF